MAEEAPGFTAWARRHASARYSQRDFLAINASGLLGSWLATRLITRRPPGRRAFFAFHTAVVTQQALWNPVFHAGTTVRWREYSPGLVTALALFPALWAVTTRRAIREGLLTRRGAAASAVAGGALHAAAVAQQVFYVGR